MVKIRLKRIGRKKLSFYRIVVADSRSAGNKMYIDLLGTYDPINHLMKINETKTSEWIKKGAVPTDTMRQLLSKEGILKRIYEEKQAAR